MSEGLAGVTWRPPPLTSERLLLRGYEPSDVDAIYAYASDEEVTRYMSFERHRSPDDALGFLDQYVAPGYRAMQHEYAICLRERPDHVIGGVGARILSEQHQSYELGYLLGRAHWGVGLAPEAARLTLAQVFSATPAERIQASVFAENQRSHRVAARLGMQRDGVLRSSLCLRGRRWDLAVYSILRSEWERAA
jgi:ribosomal-protein-alanine N-acetyltransferase